jgi:CDP-diacylglycerol---serine O-phosphatidyltransferase
MSLEPLPLRVAMVQDKLAEAEHPRRTLPLTRLLPNMLTLLALCSGMSAIRFALQERWEMAVGAICIAAVFDMLDGRVARLLRITSKFGAELDSLSDLISFGVAPAFILYRWVLGQEDQLGWLAVLGFVICAALRLARFNTMLDDGEQPAWRKSFFVGVPTPGAAGLALLPMAWSFSMETELLRTATPIALWLIVLAGLMVSRLPVLSLKGQRVPRTWIVPIFVIMAVCVAQLVTNPWRTIGWLGLIYLLIMPYGWVLYRRYQRQQTETA